MLQSIVLRNRRQTKSLVSSAAGECLCGRFSLTELTKQAMLPLLAVSSVKADHKVYVSPPENQQVIIWINVSN